MRLVCNKITAIKAVRTIADRHNVNLGLMPAREIVETLLEEIDAGVFVIAERRCNLNELHDENISLIEYFKREV